jgi:hypothetical protein
MVRMRHLRTHPNSDTAITRAHLAKHVESIVMEPDGKAHIASGKWNLLGDRRWEWCRGRGLYHASDPGLV